MVGKIKCSYFCRKTNFRHGYDYFLVIIRVQRNQYYLLSVDPSIKPKLLPLLSNIALSPPPIHSTRIRVSPDFSCLLSTQIYHAHINVASFFSSHSHSDYSAFNSTMSAQCRGRGGIYTHKSCKQVRIRSLRNLIRESTPLKDTETERDKTVIKPSTSETISRPSSRGRGDVTMKGWQSETPKWRNAEMRG